MKTALIVIGILVKPLEISSPFSKVTEHVHWIINKLVAFTCPLHEFSGLRPFDETIFIKTDTEEKFPRNNCIRIDRIRHTIFEMENGADIFSARIKGDSPHYRSEVRKLGTYLRNYRGVERIAILGLVDINRLLEMVIDAKHLWGFKTFIVEDGIIEENKEVLSEFEKSVYCIKSDTIQKEWCHKVDS